MLFRTYISCTSNPELNELFRTNRIRLINEESVYHSFLEVADEAAKNLMWKKSDHPILYFIFFGFSDEDSLMIKYKAEMTFKKTTIYRTLGNKKIPKVLHHLFPPKLESDYTIEIIETEEIPNGKFPT